MNSKETCLICFAEIEKHIIVPGGESDKILKVCLTYLHDAIIRMTLKNVQLKNKSRLPFCRNCFDFALELTKLSEQLAKFEKKVLDTAVTFSLSVFHRKSKVDNSGHSKTSDGQSAKKKIIEIDVTEISTHRFSSRQLLQDGRKRKKFETDHIDDTNNLGHRKPEEECTVDMDIVKHELYDEDDETPNLSSLELLNPMEVSFEEDGNDSLHSFNHSVSEDELHQNESSIPKEAKNYQERETKATPCSVSHIKKSVRMPQIRIRRLQFESTRRKMVVSRKIYEDKSDHNSSSSESDKECGIEPEVSDFEDEMRNDTKISTKLEKKRTVKKIEIVQGITKSQNCDYCHEVFETKGQLDNHQKKVHNSQLRVKCSICQKTLGNANILKQHRIRIHFGEKIHKCSFCDRAFTTVSSRNRHMLVHGTENKFHCSKCPKTFKLKASLQIHLRTHEPIKTLYQCLHCGKTFGDKPCLRNHEKTHAPEKLHKCGYCDRRFTMAYHRRRHERVHTGEKPYKCIYCNKTFASTAAKVVHQRTHTGERPYNCTYCDKSFRQSNALVKHQRIHTGERPYECLVCEKTFNCSTVLRRHARIHTGDKPHSCSICDKAFMSSAELKRHAKIHGNKPFKCDQCNVTFRTKQNMLQHQASEHNIVTIVNEEVEVEYEAEDDEDKK